MTVLDYGLTEYRYELQEEEFEVTLRCNYTGMAASPLLDSTRASSHE